MCRGFRARAPPREHRQPDQHHRRGEQLRLRQAEDHRLAEPLAYTTAMTALARLADKQVLARVRDGRGYVYEPAVSDVAQMAVRGVMREYGDAAMARFVYEARADPEMLERLRRLVGD